MLGRGGKVSLSSRTIYDNEVPQCLVKTNEHTLVISNWLYVDVDVDGCSSSPSRVGADMEEQRRGERGEKQSREDAGSAGGAGHSQNHRWLLLPSGGMSIRRVASRGVEEGEGEREREVETVASR